MRAPDGTTVEPIVLDRGRGREQLFKVTDARNYFLGYYSLEQLARIVDLGELVEVDKPPPS